MKREWMIGELIEVLSKHPKDAKIKLEDADTNWTIHKFQVGFLEGENEFWFYPSDYSEMTS